MSTTREQDVIHAFVDLTNDLVSGYDMVELLAGLSENCVRLLDVAAAGVLLSDGRGVLRLVAASSERTRLLELFQLQRDEGPCLDCFRTGTPVLVPELAATADRWPAFCAAADGVGFRSVHAVPMRLQTTVLGTLGLFGSQVGSLDRSDLDLGQALAHVASVAVVNERAAADSATVNAQLQHALTSRVVLEQAKGVIAHVGDLTVEDAFRVMRRYARDHGRRLGEVAGDVVERRLAGRDLLEHARSVDLLPEE
ncbi:GAF and ANTAR domain-containing protein [Phycicoccus flavus]|uniref:GAF and ANTAR domain-containing protein n=1 Tax=Phycicoccus flavus TaxID=2502783 RepID=UPI00197B0C60|nr:GAF and ANTAR domain-containing protein [Phycicoccus flavus]